MTKSILAALALTVAGFAWADDAIQPEGRLDIDGTNSGINLAIGDVIASGDVNNASWMDAEKNKQYIAGSFDIAPDWKQAGYTFTPDKDGTVMICLRSRWTDDKPPVWSLIDDVKVEGAQLVNGDFEKGSDGWDLQEKDDKTKSEIVANGRNGSKAVKVAHDAPACQSIDVKAKTPVKITFWFKAAQ